MTLEREGWWLVELRWGSGGVENGRVDVRCRRLGKG